MTSPNAERIFLSPPDVRGPERAMLLDALESNWIAPLGPHVDGFEEELSQYVGVPNATALSSGTAALHLALAILGVGPGDKVIVPSLTFVATANAVRYLGAEPIFVDSEEDGWNICPEALESTIETLAKEGPPAKVLIVVDLYGDCANYKAILPLAEKHDLPVVEDAAEALGATLDGKHAGSFGCFGVFSFNGNKIITTSGGGMLVSRDASHIERARYLSTQARQAVAHYEHTEVGYNYRLSNILAALGRAQLSTLDERISIKRSIAARYSTSLASLPGLSMMKERDGTTGNAWLTPLLVNEKVFGCSRDAIIAKLAKENIESRAVWKPMHMQPLFSNARYFGANRAQRYFETGICLPSGSALKDEQVSRICSLVAECAK